MYGEVLEFLTETKKNFKSTTQQLKTKVLFDHRVVVSMLYYK